MTSTPEKIEEQLKIELRNIVAPREVFDAAMRNVTKVEFARHYSKRGLASPYQQFLSFMNSKILIGVPAGVLAVVMVYAGYSAMNKGTVAAPEVVVPSAPVVATEPAAAPETAPVVVQRETTANEVVTATNKTSSPDLTSVFAALDADMTAESADLSAETSDSDFINAEYDNSASFINTDYEANI